MDSDAGRWAKEPSPRNPPCCSSATGGQGLGCSWCYRSPPCPHPTAWGKVKQKALKFTQKSHIESKQDKSYFLASSSNLESCQATSRCLKPDTGFGLGWCCFIFQGMSQPQLWRWRCQWWGRKTSFWVFPLVHSAKDWRILWQKVESLLQISSLKAWKLGCHYCNTLHKCEIHQWNKLIFFKHQILLPTLFNRPVFNNTTFFDSCFSCGVPQGSVFGSGKKSFDANKLWSVHPVIDIFVSRIVLTDWKCAYRSCTFIFMWGAPLTAPYHAKTSCPPSCKPKVATPLQLYSFLFSLNEVLLLAAAWPCASFLFIFPPLQTSLPLFTSVDGW